MTLVLPATPSTDVLSARIGPCHGYALDGEHVHLNATIEVDDPAVAGALDWALQLWACAEPCAGGTPCGTLVAETDAAPLGATSAVVHGSRPANLPAGSGAHAMVLALVSRGADGVARLHDTVDFPQRQRFALPRLVGDSAFRIDGDRLHLTVGAIENPRDADTLSGTLVLELWALSAPYSGTDFSGVCLGSVHVGAITGQTCVTAFTADGALTLPPAGTWLPVLMLREWTAAGYVTRDYVQFPLPLPLQIAPGATGPDEAVEAVGTPESIHTVGPVEVAEAAGTVEAVGEAIEPVEVVETVEVARVAKEVEAPAAAVPAHGGVSAKKRKGTAEPAEPVSVNSASIETLAAVKGLPKAVASAIVAERPFMALDELARVKGIGRKLLDKLRARLSL